MTEKEFKKRGKDMRIKELEKLLEDCWNYLSDNPSTCVFGLGLMCMIEEALEETKPYKKSVLGVEEEQLDMFGGQSD